MTLKKKDEHMICTRCIYDSRVSSITFDKQGICNYCHQIDALIAEYGTGTKKGDYTIDKIVNEIKKKGANKKYDCIVGVSGGTDSSYMLYWAVKNGLRPLAVHYDNTWNTAIATENIRKVLSALNVDKSGLDDMDIKILTTIINKFKGGPVGLTTIATAVGEQAGTIEEVYEPFLIKEGYLMLSLIHISEPTRPY